MTVTREKYQLAFGKRMEYVMKQSGMKYEAVADRADLSINVLHRWTHGSAMKQFAACWDWASDERLF